MLLRFEITNFLSFYKTTSFDMFPNNKRTTFTEHVYSDADVPLLKLAAIYGANGAGKSNFIKAFDFLRDFVTQNDFLDNVDLDSTRFQLVTPPLEKLNFVVEFCYKGKYYFYEVRIEEHALWEKLSLSGLGKKEHQPIFERYGTEIRFSKREYVSVVKLLLERNPRASLLALNKQFPIFDVEDVNDAYQWFAEQTEVVTIHSIAPRLIELLNRDSELLAFTNKLFSDIGLGIRSLAVANTPFEEWVTQKRNTDILRSMINDVPTAPHSQSIVQNERNILSVTQQGGRKKVLELLFDQFGQGGFHKQLPITAQSDGTVKLLLLAPALYDALYQGKIVFIDEIDNSVHPALIFRLLQFYARGRSNGQLIFTTHSNNLLNQQEPLRPDEVWFTMKENGATQMYSLNDYKLDNTLDIEKGYLDGRYGGMPTISISELEDEL